MADCKATIRIHCDNCGRDYADIIYPKRAFAGACYDAGWRRVTTPEADYVLCPACARSRSVP
jgi:hypothetical protein